jgi:hypothetical protein
MTTVWLLALVVLAKGTLTSLCLVDGLAAPEPSTAVAVMTSADATVTQADDEAASCWHAGSGGCHCTCFHTSALPAITASWDAMPPSAARIARSTASLRHVLLPPSLRPPIA